MKYYFYLIIKIGYTDISRLILVTWQHAIVLGSVNRMRNLFRARGMHLFIAF